MKETKVYVEELPESCFECPIMVDGSEGCDFCVCAILEEKAITKNRLKDCPLKSLHDHDKELVEKVLEKVSIELENETGIYCEIRQCNSPHYQGDYVWFNYVKFRKLAEKLQKEFEK